MKIVVCGGRNFKDVDLMHDTMNALHSIRSITLLANGDARGADWWANQWAIANGVDVCKFPVNWRFKNKADAESHRNAVMLAVIQPDLVVAFLGGKNTADVTRQAALAGMTVLYPGVGKAVLYPEGGAA